MNKTEVSNIFTRFTNLFRYDNIDSICRKMNAEFNATFYRSQGNVWARYNDENGKSVVRVLNKEVAL